MPTIEMFSQNVPKLYQSLIYRINYIFYGHSRIEIFPFFVSKFLKTELTLKLHFNVS